MPLEATDLHDGYGRAEVLSGPNFSLAERQVASVIGPNGAGKSTPLAALAGICIAARAVRRRAEVPHAVVGRSFMRSSIRRGCTGQQLPKPPMYR